MSALFLFKKGDNILKKVYFESSLDVERIKKKVRLRKIGALIVSFAAMEAFFLGMRLATYLSDVLCIKSELAQLAFKESVYTVVALVLLVLYGPRRLKVFQKPYVRTPKPALFCLAFCYFTSAYLRFKLIEMRYGFDPCNTRPLNEILMFTITVLLVGIAEETIFRGIIAEKMIRAFGRSLSGRQKAATISGIMFGLMHFVNLSHAEPDSVIIQVISVSVIGIFLSEIYYSTKSLWPVIIIHSVNNFFAMSPFGIYGAESFDSTISSYKPIMVLPFIMLFIIYNCMYCNMKMMCPHERVHA